jgi:hypothetical protein
MTVELSGQLYVKKFLNKTFENKNFKNKIVFFVFKYRFIVDMSSQKYR